MESSLHLISDRIKHERLIAGMTQKQLSKACGLKVHYISRLENKQFNIPIWVPNRILAVFNVEMIMEIVPND